MLSELVEVECGAGRIQEGTQCRQTGCQRFCGVTGVTRGPGTPSIVPGLPLTALVIHTHRLQTEPSVLLINTHTHEHINTHMRLSTHLHRHNRCTEAHNLQYRSTTVRITHMFTKCIQAEHITISSRKWTYT